MQSRGARGDGVFVPLGGKSVSPRIEQALAVVAGLALLGVGVAAHGRGAADPISAGVLQALLVAAAVGLMLGGLLGLYRALPALSRQRFLWADARQVWWVDGRKVRVLLHSALEEVRATHHYRNACYQWTVVEFRHAEGKELLTVHAKSLAGRLVGFVSFVLATQRAQEAPAMQALQEAPELLGVVAAAVAEQGQEVFDEGMPLANLSPGLSIPLPYGEPALAAATRATVQERAAPWVVAASFGLVGCLVLPQFETALHEEQLFRNTLQAVEDETPFHVYFDWYPRGYRAEQVRLAFEEHLYHNTLAAATGEEYPYLRYLQVFPESRRVQQVREAHEENLFDHVRQGGSTDHDCCRAYLNAFPGGKHAAVVRALYDDRLFTAADEAARRQADVTPLGDYLADGRNTRHAEEARRLIAAMQERAQATLTVRDAGPGLVGPLGDLRWLDDLPEETLTMRDRKTVIREGQTMHGLTRNIRPRK